MVARVCAAAWPLATLATKLSRGAPGPENQINRANIGRFVYSGGEISKSQLPMHSLFGDISNIISLSITPAFLMLGVLLQIRVLNNRLERISDRREVLEQRLSAGGVPALLQHELVVLYQRAEVIHRAVSFSSVSMVTVCAVVVALFADDMFNLPLDSLIAFLFVAAMLMLVCSFSLLLHEIFVASHSMPSRALLPARQRDLHH